jgi:hypothetical protein
MPEHHTDKRWMVAGLVVGFFVIALALMLLTGIILSR